MVRDVALPRHQDIIPLSLQNSYLDLQKWAEDIMRLTNPVLYRPFSSLLLLASRITLHLDAALLLFTSLPFQLYHASIFDSHSTSCHALSSTVYILKFVRRWAHQYLGVHHSIVRGGLCAPLDIDLIWLGLNVKDDMFEIKHTNITVRSYLSSQHKLPPRLLG